MIKFLLDKEKAEFLERYSSIVVTENGDKWFYFPYWWHKETIPLGEDIPPFVSFDRYVFEELPEDLKKRITEIRDE